MTDTDFHRWALETADLIKRRELRDIDWDRVAEEIHDLGISQEYQLASRCAQLMYHLLKIRYQPERHSVSWDRTVRGQRRAIQNLLIKQPSLEATLRDQEFWAGAYDDAVSLSGPENLPDEVVNQFPEDCPFTLEILDA